MDIDPSQNSFPLALPARACLALVFLCRMLLHDAVVDDDEASRQCNDRLSPLPETIETSGSCLGSSGDNQLEDDEMALEQPESESAGSVPRGQLGTEIQAKWTLKGVVARIGCAGFAPSLQFFF